MPYTAIISRGPDEPDFSDLDDITLIQFTTRLGRKGYIITGFFIDNRVTTLTISGRRDTDELTKGLSKWGEVKYEFPDPSPDYGKV